MKTKPGQYRRRCLVCFCIYAAAVAVAVAIVVIVLWKTVYKVKEPRMTINSFTVGQLNVSSNINSSSLRVVADASVENPNAVAFRFGVSTTSLSYRGSPVGQAHGPAGSTGAHGTFRANVTFDVAADGLLRDPHFLSDVQAGALGMETSTMLGGRVKFLGVFGRHVDVVMNCTVSVSVSNQTVLDQYCVSRVWL